MSRTLEKKHGGFVGGEFLLKSIIELTGLPEDLMNQELDRLIQKAGMNRSTMSLDDMRVILAEYLQDTLLDIKNTYEGQV